MRQNASNVALFVLLAAGLTAGWWYVDTNFIPKPEQKPPREALFAVAGAAVVNAGPAADWRTTTRVPPPTLPPAPTPDPNVPPPAVAAPSAPPELVPLGDDTFYTRVMLTTAGGAVQRLVLTRFDEANRLGREVKLADGRPQPLHLIPGVRTSRDEVSLTAIHDDPAVARLPDLPAGPVTDPELRKRLAEPSYQLLHYPAADDPLRQPDDADAMNGSRPSPDLGLRPWTVAERSPGKVAFETELGAPYFLKLRKTYTLAPKDYHFGLTLDVTPLPGRVKGKGEFKYQLVGPRGLPIEGEWYTTVYRNVMIGWTNPAGGMKRAFEDAGTIQLHHGGERVGRADNRFAYAAVASQYFASALCPDDSQDEKVRKNLWDYVRPTRETAEPVDPAHPYLGDVTFRAVAAPLNPGPADSVSQRYLVYSGPIKVRQLGMLRDANGVEKAVAPELVDRYQDALNLRTLTDYHSPNFFGRLANAIWWSDVVIFMTNVMHQVLFWLNGLVPVWGLNIVMLTVLVRLLLFAPSRKQQQSVMRMQEKMAALKPELEKLQERHKDDYQGLQQAKTKLMLENGVNPLSTTGGCFLLFAQMPILMGLYFCLQESVFFRLEPLVPGFTGWVPNLAAPDMLVWWTENIPVLSDPAGLAGTLYLGPYFNVLPLVAVALIFIHQKMTLPPPTDEQQEMQQKMMKFMVVIMGVFFYKVAAGLCIYFICSTSWALAERKLIPKPKPGDLALPLPAGGPDPGGKSAAGGNGAAARPGFMARMLAAVEEAKRQADEQSQRQIRNDPRPPAGGNGAGPGPNRPNRDKKNRKKR